MRTLGDYTLLDELGRGGMGVVYRARSPAGALVALKVLERAAALDPELALRFRLEADAGLSLDHPGIARVLDAGQHDGVPYLALELLEGPNLQQVLTAEGPLEPGRASALVRALAEALAHAHERGVLHRDLKPANVILAARGPVLTDLGLAKVRDHAAASLTASGEVLGTPAYMAPEQAAGERHAIGVQTDVYGLGATLYALLTGRPPFSGPTPIRIMEAVVEREPAPPCSLRAGIPPQLERVCLRCLAKAPEARYSSARALIQALDSALGASADAPSGPAPPTRNLALAALLAALALATGAGFALLHRRPASAPTTSTSPPALEEAEDLLRTRAFEQARAAFEARLAARPDELASVLGLGWTILECTTGIDERSYEQILSLVHRAQVLSPDDPDASVLEACAEWQLGGDSERARGLLERVLADHPEHFRALRASAQVAFQLRDLERAELELTKAQALEPDDPELLRAWGVLYRHTGRPSESERVLRQLLARNPADGLARAYLGDALVNAGRPEEGAEELARACRDSPRVAEVWALRGSAAAALGQAQEELACYDRALELEPTHALALQLRARPLLSLGRRLEAKDALRSVVVRFPKDCQAWATLGTMLFEDGEYLEASEALAKTIALEPTQERPRLQLADALVALERPLEAAEQLQRLLYSLSEPNRRSPVLMRLAVIWRDQGQLARAQTCLEQARRIRPRDPELLWLLAQVATLRNEPAQAREALEAYVEVEPGQAEAWYTLSGLRLFQGDLEGAELALDACQRLQPENPRSKVSRCYMRLLLGQPDQARTLFDSLPSAYQRSDHGRSLESFLLLREGQPALALRSLEGQQTTAPLPLYVRGEACRALGRLAEARRNLEAYLRIEPPQPLADEVRETLQGLDE